MADTIHVFLHDPTFVNRDYLAGPVYAPGGLFVPKDDRLSFFSNMHRIRDPRDSRYNGLPFVTNSKPIILLDDTNYTDFIANYTNTSEDIQTSVFSIIEKIFFLLDGTETLSTIDNLLTTDPLCVAYMPSSLVIAPSTSTGTAYSSDGSTYEHTTFDWALFNIAIPLEDETITYEVKVWASDGAFEVGYPLSHITAVVPPLDFNTLLTGSLVGGASNPFSVAMSTAQISQNTLDPAIRVDDNTGVTLRRIVFYDTVGNTALVPFNILYKGGLPSVIEIRKSIRELVLASGVGTEDQWRARAPELFVDNQFYIIPQWNIVTTRPDQVLYPNITPFPKMLQNVRLALPHISLEIISETTEAITVTYKVMTLTGTPHVLNNEYQSILELHETYQNYATTADPFKYMEPHTQKFSLGLNRALVIADGLATDPLYDIRTESGANYVTFVIDDVEYYVMTKESFFNLVGV